MSNPDNPSPYRPDPRRGGRFDGESDGRRGRYSPRSGSGGGGSARAPRPGYRGRGADGYGGSHARTADPGGDDGWGRNGAEESAADGGGTGGRSWRRGEQDGWPLRGRADRGGRSGRGEGRLSGRRDPRDWLRGEEEGDWTGRVGRGVSSARDRYAAARERYAARRGGGQADGYRPASYQGAAFEGAGYEGATGYDIRRRLARPGERLPGRGLPGRNGNGGSGRGGGRRKGDWWRHWTWKKAASVGAAVCAAMAMLGAGIVGVAYAKTPIPDPQAAATQAASTVYFSNGKTLVGQFGTYDRQKLTLAQIPAVLQNAVVAAEDKNFYHEGGISPTGILRAAYYDLTSSGGSLQGGSTITQQLVRNFYTDIGTTQTMSRKIKEIFVAEKLARARSKQWILQEYLNTVYFGQGAYGVGAAASVYFGLTPATLHKITPAQAAMIAAMIQSPSYYTPNPKGGAAYHALVSRWQYVLGSMVKMGTLSQQQANQALAKFPTVVKPVNNSWSGYNGYIMQAVLYELTHAPYNYSKQKIFNGGLRITTTFSQRLMKSLYATVRANRTLMRHGTPPSPPFTPHVACRSSCLPSWVHIGAVLEDPATGAILAMYSGKNFSHNQYDDALESRNQVGSSFKPYVLATAVSQGMNVMTSKLNGYQPLWIPPDSQPQTFATIKNQSGNGWYQVRNDEVTNPDRPVSVVEATAMSLNTSFADLWHRVALNPQTGAHSVVDMAKAFGVDPVQSGLLTMRDEAGTALGQASLTVEEQANTIATMADNGIYHAPHVIKEIQDGNATIRARVATHMVLNPDQAAEVDYAMSFDDGPMGTANGLGLTNGQKIIAKTGTTNLSQSAFFMGATPRYAMAVGMFVSKPTCPASDGAACSSAASLAFGPPTNIQTLFGVGGLSGYGGQWPALIWHDFFMKNFNGLGVQPWPALPANFGSAWNLVDPKMITKPHPHPHRSFSPPCFGNGHKCRPTPGPTVPQGCPPPPLPCSSATPTITPTGPPTAGAVGGVAAGGLVVGGLVAGGLATGGLAAGWFPGRRRRPGRQAGNRDS